MKHIVRRTALLTIIILALLAVNLAQSPPPPIPNPVLVLFGQEYATVGGRSIVRYVYGVDNFEAIPNELFLPAPKLPPCGKNNNSSRSWVDLFDQTGKRLNGFCALGKNKDLNGIWFALDEGVVPPSYIYIEIYDRQTNTKYKSNLADTTL